MQAFIFYPGEYLRDTQCLSPNSQVAYDRIMCEHVRNTCINSTQLNFFTKKLNEEEKAELMNVLTEKDGCFYISWIVAVEFQKPLAAKKETKVTTSNGLPFDLFWNEYDKKVGDRKKIEKKWALLTIAVQNEILDYIPKYKEAQPEKKFRKNAETFFNNKSWEDEIISSTVKPNKGVEAVINAFDGLYKR